MKAILKFFLGQESIDLEKMDLYELDKMLMERFDDSADLKLNGKYYKMINELFLKHPDRDNYKQPNGSIRIFLENDDGTPILEKRSFNNEPEEIVQKQIRVLYKKDIDNYTKYGMNNFLILRFQENPEELRNFLKKLFFKLYNDGYTKENRGLNDFINFKAMIDVQKSMFGDAKSLFTDKKINIKNKKEYDERVMDFVHSIRFNKLGDLYLDIREAAAREIDFLNVKPKKVLKYDPIEKITLDEMIFGKKNNIDDFHKELIINDYIRLQTENNEFREMEDMGTRYKKK